MTNTKKTATKVEVEALKAAYDAALTAASEAEQALDTAQYALTEAATEEDWAQKDLEEATEAFAEAEAAYNAVIK